MNAAKIVAIVLIAVGVIGLTYGGLTYTKDRQEISLGSMSMTVSDKRTIPIPLWAGVAAIVLGAGLLLAPASKG